jgi:hypothetical protein
LKLSRAQIALALTSVSASGDIFEKKSASAALFGERERWFSGALVKLAFNIHKYQQCDLS